MTLQERAEKITEAFEALHGFKVGWLTDRIESELRAAVEEAVKDSQHQPCRNFTEHDVMYNRHECPDCLGIRMFCDNCNRDHHEGGWCACKNIVIERLKSKANEALEKAAQVAQAHECAIARFSETCRCDEEISASIRALKIE